MSPLDEIGRGKKGREGGALLLYNPRSSSQNTPRMLAKYLGQKNCNPQLPVIFLYCNYAGRKNLSLSFTSPFYTSTTVVT
jgi:hypothetical protein